jgi:glycosyltransferase involved in cell wall biosynthesis
MRLATPSKVAPSRRSTTAIRYAYLLSRYPAVSHTFLLKEVQGLRARGLHIETVSINPPDRPSSRLSEEESHEARATRYLKGGKTLSTLMLLLRIIAIHPAATIRGLRGVLSIRRMRVSERGYWLFYLAEALLLGDWMRSRRLNHLHVHFGGPVAAVGMLTSIAWRIPYSLTIHGPEELLNTDAEHLREKLTQASRIICISDFCRSQLMQILPPGQWSKLHVVRLGVDPAAVAPSLTRPPAKAERSLEIVCTGRLVPAKGHRILIEALAALRDRGIDFTATLIGDGPERQGLVDFTRKRGLESCITFTSSLPHDETLARVRDADIFVLASFAEGIPVALMEAMALGVPCVSTSIAGIPELIQTGRDGILVAPSNAVELADALALLAGDPTLRQFLARSARRRIVHDYNLPLNQEKLAQCFAAQETP